MAFNQCLTENVQTNQLFDVTFKNVNTTTINNAPYLRGATGATGSAGATGATGATGAAGAAASVGALNELNVSDGVGSWRDPNMSISPTTGGQYIDLNSSSPGDNIIGYSSVDGLFIVSQNDQIVISTTSLTTKNISISNSTPSGTNIISSDNHQSTAVTSASLSETTDGHLLSMSSSGINLTCGSNQPLGIVTLGNPGSVGDVLTNLSGGAGWAPSSGGATGATGATGSAGATGATGAGGLPTYMTQVVNPVMFGSSSDATSCFISSSGTAPTFYANGSLPWPGDPSTITFSPTPPYNVGTVPFSLVPGVYALNLGVLGSPSTGIIQFTITNVTSGGSPTVLTFDTYTSNPTNIQINIIGQFTVLGIGYQNILVNILCNSKNSSSTAYALLPCTDLTISPVYTI